MATVTSKQSGPWSDTNTWNGGAVPGSGDTVTIQSGHTVTFDVANLTVGADSATAAINVAAGGKLMYPSTAPASVTVTAKGDVQINGTLEIGTQASPIPSNLTFTLNLNSSAAPSDGKYGLRFQNGSTSSIYGAFKTPWTLLAANAAAGDGVVGKELTVQDPLVNWLGGELVVIASTSRTYSECERRNLNGVQTGTSLRLLSALTYAHQGTGLVQAEVAALNRNVVITAANQSYVGYVLCDTTAVVNIDSVEFSYIGGSLTDKYGVVFKTTTGSVRITNSVVHDTKCAGFFQSGGSTNNIFLDHCVASATQGAYSYAGFNFYNATPGTNLTMTNCLAIANVTSGAYGFILKDCNGTISDNRAAGNNGTGFQLSDTSTMPRATLSRLIAHSNASYGISHETCRNTVMSDCQSLRNNNTGFNQSLAYNIGYVNCDAFGNTNGWFFNGHSHVLTNCRVSSEASYLTNSSVLMGADTLDAILEGCDFGGGTGRAAASFDMNPTFGDAQKLRFTFIGCKFAGAMPTINWSNYKTLDQDDTWIAFHNLNQIAGNHKVLQKGGELRITATTFRTTSPAEQLVPNQASSTGYKVRSGIRTIPAAAGSTTGVTVYVKTDGAYNGLNPRLMLRRNYAGGVMADLQIDGGLGSADANGWKALTGTIPATVEDTAFEVFVDCDGTAGNCYVDDWSV